MASVVVAVEQRSAVVEPGDVKVVIVAPIVRSVVVALLRGALGPEGPTGPPGEVTDLALVASEAIGGHKLVYAFNEDLAAVFSATDTSLVGRNVGFTTGAASDGGDLSVRTHGPLEGFSGLIPDALYYAGAAGAITATPPTANLLVPVGFALTATKLFINIGTTYIL